MLPLFTEALAGELRVLWDRLGRPAPFTVCEVGPGDGSLAAGLAGALADLPLELVLCERAEGLVARQRERLPAARHVALADLAPVTGAIVANEVHDACPAHVLRWPDELRVGVDGSGHFAWVVAGAAPETLRRIVERSVAAPPPGLELAVSPAQAELQGLLAGRVARGALFVFDYGEDGPERYLRPVPHLRTYLAGRPGGDPLAGPGAQDITVDVDFGASGRPARARVCARCSTSRSRCGCGGTARSSASRRCRSGARSGSGSSRSPGTRHRARASACSCRSVSSREPPRRCARSPT